MFNLFEQNIKIQSLKDEVLSKHNIKLSILRLDLIDEHISGNKLFKLKYNIVEAQKAGYSTLLTLGGAYSNHIAATAAAGKQFGFNTIGVIRGEKKTTLNPTLQFAQNCGMQLHYVTREEYKNKDELIKELRNNITLPFYYLPEGGANNLGVKGCGDIVKFIDKDIHVVALACGTGTTMAGIINNLQCHSNVVGFQVLKAPNYIDTEIKKWLNSSQFTNWEVNENYHFNGYAKVNTQLIDFTKWFYKTHDIKLDLVYTAKMMYGLYSLIKDNKFNKHTNVLAIHTGGLQGNAGFNLIFD